MTGLPEKCRNLIHADENTSTRWSDFRELQACFPCGSWDLLHHCFLAEHPCFSKAASVTSGGGAVRCCGAGVWKSFPHWLHRIATNSPCLK